MNYTKQIFEMLGVAPNEEFYIKSSIVKHRYRITNELIVKFKDDDGVDDFSIHPIRDFLIGNLEIQKIIKPTKKEQLAIDYGKTCGFQWMAKDMNGEVYYYERFPTKGHAAWDPYLSKVAKCLIDISFIHWEDEEPYYIGDEEDD